MQECLPAMKWDVNSKQIGTSYTFCKNIAAFFENVCV